MLDPLQVQRAKSLPAQRLGFRAGVCLGLRAFGLEGLFLFMMPGLWSLRKPWVGGAVFFVLFFLGGGGGLRFGDFGSSVSQGLPRRA